MSGSLTGIITHTQRVQRLYKRALRNIQSFYCNCTPAIRYRSVLLRQRFDNNKYICDPTAASEMVCLGEEELRENLHWDVVKFHGAPGGTNFEREVILPDWIVDYWDALEKAQYPEYFQKRELRKKDYIKFYEDTYGKSTFKPAFDPAKWFDQVRSKYNLKF